MIELTCCFLGHRKIDVFGGLKERLYETVEGLITKGVTTFLFGSRSEFDDLCLNIVSSLKQKYPHIKRIYVRGEYPYIDEKYKNYLLKSYDDAYFSEKALNAGKIAYIVRNREMIDKSDICVFYYDEKNTNGKGTRLAFEYAIQKKKLIFNMF